MTVTLERLVRTPLPSFEFARIAFDITDGLTGEQVHLRREPSVRALLEEVLPIAALAKSWERPERRGTVEYFGANHPFDATLAFSGRAITAGFIEPLYYLEVTSALFAKDHYEREALGRYGSVFLGDPNIRRVGSRRRGGDRIVSQATAQDGDSPMADLAAWVVNAIEAKAQHSYPEPSLLVVRAEPSKPLTSAEWCSVLAATSPAAQSSKFTGVILVDWFNAAVHQL